MLTKELTKIINLKKKIKYLKKEILSYKLVTTGYENKIDLMSYFINQIYNNINTLKVDDLNFTIKKLSEEEKAVIKTVWTTGPKPKKRTLNNLNTYRISYRERDNTSTNYYFYRCLDFDFYLGKRPAATDNPFSIDDVYIDFLRTVGYISL